MEKQYYKEYYHLERNHWWFRARGEILIDHFRTVLKKVSYPLSITGKDKNTTEKPLRILNIGTATGHTSELLMQLGDVESVEYDKDCYEFVKQHLGISIINASILDLPYPDQSFDIVVAFDVIEHVEDDAKAVSEMYRVCKNGGIVGVTVPAFMFLWSAHDEVNHHYRRYDSRQLKGLFAPLPVKNVFHSYFNAWLFFPIAAFRLASRLLPKKKQRQDEETASDFGVLKGGFVNKLFYAIFKSENFFLKRLISLSVGVSLLSTWQKRSGS